MMGGFNSRGPERQRSNGRRSGPFGGGPFASLFNDDFFGESGFGDDLFKGGGSGGMSTSFSSFQSSSFSGGGRGMSTSTQTKTYIGPDGRRITRKETTGTYIALVNRTAFLILSFHFGTVIHPDGRRESNVEEFVDDSHARIGYNNINTNGFSSNSGALAPARSSSSSYEGRSSGSHRGKY